MNEQLICPACKRLVDVEEKKGYGEVWTTHDNHPLRREVCSNSQRPILVQVHVTFPPEAIEEDDIPVAGEFLWARPTQHPDHFKLDNIPFFSGALSLDDIVEVGGIDPAPNCHHDEGECKHCTARQIQTIVESTNNITAHLLFLTPLEDPDDRKAVREALATVGVTRLEWANTSVVGLDCPEDIVIADMLAALPADLPSEVMCDLEDAPTPTNTEAL